METNKERRKEGKRRHDVVQSIPNFEFVSYTDRTLQFQYIPPTLLALPHQAKPNHQSPRNNQEVRRSSDLLCLLLCVLVFLLYSAYKEGLYSDITGVPRMHFRALCSGRIRRKFCCIRGTGYHACMREGSRRPDAGSSLMWMWMWKDWDPGAVSHRRFVACCVLLKGAVMLLSWSVFVKVCN